MFDRHRYSGIFREIKLLERVYEDIDISFDEISIKELNGLNDELGRFDRIEEECLTYMKEARLFLQNDFSLMCFLTSDRSEQIELAKYILDNAGHSSGRQKAKEYLAELKGDVKKQFSADRIECL